MFAFRAVRTPITFWKWLGGLGSDLELAQVVRSGSHSGDVQQRQYEKQEPIRFRVSGVELSYVGVDN